MHFLKRDGEGHAPFSPTTLRVQVVKQQSIKVKGTWKNKERNNHLRSWLRIFSHKKQTDWVKKSQKRGWGIFTSSLGLNLSHSCLESQNADQSLCDPLVVVSPSACFPTVGASRGDLRERHAMTWFRSAHATFIGFLEQRVKSQPQPLPLLMQFTFPLCMVFISIWLHLQNVCLQWNLNSHEVPRCSQMGWILVDMRT